MVGSSRSSLRRPALRGEQSTSRSPSPIGDAVAQPGHDGLRAKRTRLASVSERNELQKRRKLATDPEREKLRIPLRSKGSASEGALPTIATRAAPAITTVTQTSSSTNSPLHSPSIKPQYDQIKRIEEKARAAIQKEGSKPGQKDDRRRLRSEHGGTRAKTELAQYFPAFDDMLSLAPPDPDILTSSTVLILVDDTPGFQPQPEREDPFSSRKPLHNVQTIDLRAHLPSVPVKHDPLGPDVYYKAHRKAERHEKQMKNGDKERAQHEKYQLEKLLEELKGADWLKTLGITGITDTEKKRYEPKRTLFIRETKALINKFKRWKEEEKRRKLEKEAAIQEEAEEAGAETDAAASTSVRKSRKRLHERASSRSPSAASSRGVPDSSELDLLASQQLLQEAKVASTRRKVTSGAPRPTPAPPPPPPAEIHKPFISFFSKRHIRDAAVAGRQRGRLVLAFGEPLADLVESEFQLPDSILTDDAIRSVQRSRRRARRGVDE